LIWAISLPLIVRSTASADSLSEAIRRLDEIGLKAKK